MRVYMVHMECGSYSDWVYVVEGIFSTYEYAKERIESERIPVYRHVGKRHGDGRCVEYDRWDTAEFPYRSGTYNYWEDRVVDKAVIFPISTDGRTFQYVMPDGKRMDAGYETYFIEDYEVDGARG